MTLMQEMGQKVRTKMLNPAKIMQMRKFGTKNSLRKLSYENY